MVLWKYVRREISSRVSSRYSFLFFVAGRPRVRKRRKRGYDINKREDVSHS